LVLKVDLRLSEGSKRRARCIWRWRVVVEIGLKKLEVAR
jgi:hypothetical protein